MLFLNQYLNHWLIYEIILLFFLSLVFLVYLILILVYIILLVFFGFSFSSSFVLTAITIFSSNFSLAISSSFRGSILCISISNFSNLFLPSSVCSRSLIAISLASYVFSIPLGFDIFI